MGLTAALLSRRLTISLPACAATAMSAYAFAASVKPLPWGGGSAAGEQAGGAISTPVLGSWPLLLVLLPAGSPAPF